MIVFMKISKTFALYSDANGVNMPDDELIPVS
jgi:hypothetical protein